MSEQAEPQEMQFEKAEYPGDAPTEVCASCKKQIQDFYYRVGAAKVCNACAGAAMENKDSHRAFVQALVLGGLTALAGMVVYSVVTIATNMNFALLAIGVGWAVATMMRRGSGGARGRRYQVVAALLTYAAVSVSAVPSAIYFESQHTSEKQEAKGDQTAVPAEEAAKATPGLGSSLLTLLALGLASPFFELGDGIQGISGLLIIFFGMQAAWKMMRSGPIRPGDMAGPFPVNSGASST